MNNFYLSINQNNKEKVLVEFIKYIENGITGRSKNIINFVRNNSIPILNKFYNNFPFPSFNDRIILKWLHLTKIFINDHSNLLIADKGNVTVILDKDLYISKMEEVLSNVDIYSINTFSYEKVDTGLTLLTRWKICDFIDELTYKKLMTSDGNIPKAYGLTKIQLVTY